MCYYYSIGDLIELSKWYGKGFGGIGEQLKLFDGKLMNGFGHPNMPIITNHESSEFEFLSWGLIPFWAKKDIKELRKNTLNARSETIFEKPSFQHLITKKRCIVPAKYFVEWKHDGTSKIPYKIFCRDRPFFGFGGIYDEWINPEDQRVIKTFSIITTEANTMMAEIHNTKKRMPLILEADTHEAWLKSNDKELIRDLLKPYDEAAELYTKEKPG